MASCRNPEHDHTTPIDEATQRDLPQPVPMFCNDCARPTHYDEAVSTYVHDDPEAPGCFLIPVRPDGATNCVGGE